GDQGGEAGPGVPQRHLHRDHPPLLGRLRRRLPGVARLGDAQLREGRAAAGGPRGPRRGRRPLPGRPGRGDALTPIGAERRMYGEEAVRRLAAIALGASKADQTEVLFWGTDRQLTRFASNTIHQNVAEQGAEVSVRVAVGKRQGVAAANQLDEASLRDAVE